MTADKDRIWFLQGTMLVLVVICLFFLVAPGWLNYPLEEQQMHRVLQMILPVLVGYFGSVGRFIKSRKYNPAESARELADPLLGNFLRGSVYLFVVLLVALIVYFGWANRPGAGVGEGMPFESFCWWLTAIMGVVAVTITYAVASLFPERG